MEGWDFLRKRRDFLTTVSVCPALDPSSPRAGSPGNIHLWAAPGVNQIPIPRIEIHDPFGLSRKSFRDCEGAVSPFPVGLQTERQIPRLGVSYLLPSPRSTLAEILNA